jgi:RNA polymerase sigma factor (sigma-70 family)
MNPSRLDAIDTRWSLLRLAHAGPGDAGTAAARRALVLRYATAVRKYVSKLVANRDDADELAQDAVVRLMQGDFAGADPARGRFRDLLKLAVRNMVRNYWEKQKIRKTAVAELDRLAAGDDGTEAEWLAEWRQVVLDHAMAALRRPESADPAVPAEFVLQQRIGVPDASSAELADLLSRELGRPIRPDAARQMLRRARKKFAACLVEELRNGLEEDRPDAILTELADLGLLEYVRDFLPVDFAESGELTHS